MDGCFCRFRVATAQRHIGAQKSFRVIFDFLIHGRVGLAAEFKHGMCRARVGAWRHGRHVR